MSGKACACSCDCTAPKPLVFACSGASNLGQLTNSLAVRLSGEGQVAMSCLAGVGAHLSGFIVSARDSEQVLVLDGCAQRCAFKTLEHVGIVPQLYLNLGEQGFAKRHGASPTEEELDRARSLALELLKEPRCSTG